MSESLMTYDEALAEAVRRWGDGVVLHHSRSGRENLFQVCVSERVEGHSYQSWREAIGNVGESTSF